MSELSHESGLEPLQQLTIAFMNVNVFHGVQQSKLASYANISIRTVWKIRPFTYVSLFSIHYMFKDVNHCLNWCV